MSHGGTNGANGQFLATGGEQEGGFRTWLEKPEINLPKSSAYRYMQGAKNCGLTADSHIINLQAIKDTRKLNGQTLTALCRKPVDKTEQQAEIHEVSDEEQAKLDEEERNERWQAIAAQLHDYGIEADEWAKLDTDRRAGLYDVLTELAKRIKPSLRKGKPVPAVPALVAPAPEPKPHLWRVGQRTGQTRWQIKKSPNWGVVHEVDSPEQAATYLAGHGVDLSTVDVLTVAPWPSLAAHLEAQPAEPEPDGDPVCTQETIARGLWWYGWIGVRDTIMVKSYQGDMKDVIEGRAHPRVGKTFVGPFYAETLGDAEKIVREQDVNAKI